MHSHRHFQRHSQCFGEVVFIEADFTRRLREFQRRVDTREAVFECDFAVTLSRKLLISLQLTRPARPPGTGCGAFESVMPFVAAKNFESLALSPSGPVPSSHPAGLPD